MPFRYVPGAIGAVRLRYFRRPWRAPEKLAVVGKMADELEYGLRDLTLLMVKEGWEYIDDW